MATGPAKAGPYVLVGAAFRRPRSRPARKGARAMKTLDEWLAAAVDLEQIYQSELGRSVFSDREAFVNWAYHRLQNDEPLDWIRDRIRESEEWNQKHPHGGDLPRSPIDTRPPADPQRPPVPTPGGPALIQVTGAADGDFVNRIYSYWPNAWIGDRGMVYVFAGHVDERPRFFAVNMATGGVEGLGALLPFRGTAEGWYWDAGGRVYLCDGPVLRRLNPFTGQSEVTLDISSTLPGHRLWQAHSSADGQVHSATVQKIVEAGAYPAVGTVVSYRGTLKYFEAVAALDESQVTSDGAFLVIKEGDFNRIIALPAWDERRISNAAGAVGHSDCGDSIVIGEDDQRGACVLWDLRGPLTPDRKRVLFETWNMGHVSVNGGRCLLSGPQSLSLVHLDGSGVDRLIDHGMTGEGYDHQVFANLDPTGRVACYISNHGSNRFDVFLLRLP